MKKITFSVVMKSARIKLGLSQSELAKRLSKLEGSDVSKDIISRLEKNFYKPSISRVISLAKLLNINSNYLCYLTGRVQTVENVDESTFNKAWLLFSNKISFSTFLLEKEVTVTEYRQYLDMFEFLKTNVNNLNAINDAEFILKLNALMEEYELEKVLNQETEYE